MKKMQKFVVVGLFALAVIAVFQNNNDKIFMRTGLAVITGDKVDFENPLPVAAAGQEIWTVKGFYEPKDGKKVVKLSSLDFDFSGPGVEVIENVKYIVLDMTSYKGGEYAFLNK